MKRLFVFGCSYSAYSWPLWSDLLSCEYDEFHNWGLAGLGNRAICERLTECHLKHNFTSEDTVIVQWSTHLRNDFFHQAGQLTERVPGWKTAGSVFNYLNQPLYDRKWLETFFDEEAYFMHTLHFIHLAQNLLENTGATWRMTSIGEIRDLGTDIDLNPRYGEKTIFKKIENLFTKDKEKYFAYKVTPSLKAYDNAIWGKHKDKWVEPVGRWILTNFENPFYEFVDEDGNVWPDHHPKPSAHKEWLLKHMLPSLNITPKNIDRYNRITDAVDQLYKDNTQKVFIGFQRRLFLEKFDLPKWPNMIAGFTNF